MMLIQSAMRTDHVRTMQREGGGTRRACSCCTSYEGNAARKARRTQRRREAQAWQRDYRNEV